jgi:hypothetical protein
VPILIHRGTLSPILLNPSIKADRLCEIELLQFAQLGATDHHLALAVILARLHAAE